MGWGGTEGEGGGVGGRCVWKLLGERQAVPSAGPGQMEGGRGGVTEVNVQHDSKQKGRKRGGKEGRREQKRRLLPSVRWEKQVVREEERETGFIPNPVKL